ncbi:amino acid ABC transporter permease [Candidatus Bipolaricaulota sp. J31]
MELIFKWEWLPQLGKGLVLTVELTAACISIGAVLGLILAIARLYGRNVVYWLASAYVQFFRGTPLLVQLFMVHFGLAGWGIRLSPLFSGIIAMGLNTAAYQAEYFRGAIQAVKRGQTLAALSLGMTRWQTIRYVIIPQALRLVLPAWSNELVYMLKYTSIVYLIGLPDLMGIGRTIASRNFRFFEIYAVLALIYLALVLLITFALRYVEARIRVPGLGTAR